MNQQLELINPIVPQNVSFSTLSHSFVIMKNELSMQDLFHRSATINNVFLPISLGMSIAHHMVQQARVETVLMFVVDRKTTMPVLQGRFQFIGVPNTSFPLISNRNHGYITNQIEPVLPYGPIPSSLYSSHVPLVERSLATEQTMGLSTPIKDKKRKNDVIEK